MLTVRYGLVHLGETQEINIQNTIQKCNNLVSSLYKSFYLTLLPKCFTFQSPPVENMCKLLEYQSKLSIRRHVGKKLILKPPMSPKTIHFINSHESIAKLNIKLFVYELKNFCTLVEFRRVGEVAIIDQKFHASRKNCHNLTSRKKPFAFSSLHFLKSFSFWLCANSVVHFDVLCMCSVQCIRICPILS